MNAFMILSHMVMPLNLDQSVLKTCFRVDRSLHKWIKRNV